MMTFLTFGNDILADINEPGLSTIVGNADPVARKLLSSVKAALTDVGTAHEWQWLFVRANADTWNIGQATIDNCWRLKYVEYDNGTRNHLLTLIPQNAVRRWAAVAGSPMYFSPVNAKNYTVHPYPDGATEQGYVYFNYYKLPDLITADDQELEFENPFLDLISRRVRQYMHLRHTHNEKEMTFEQRSYEELLSVLKATARKPNPGTTSFSIYGA